MLAAVDYESDIDPDDLLPAYIECRTKLFNLQQSKPRTGHSRGLSRNWNKSLDGNQSEADAESRLLGKIKRIEDDVLFDQYAADVEWHTKRVQLERDAALRRTAMESSQDSSDSHSTMSQTLVESDDDEVSKEAAKIGASMLEETGSDDDAALADLFASLPVNEVDPITGKNTTVVNGSM
jgi:ATP-dependent RNA helicase DHX29